MGEAKITGINEVLAALDSFPDKIEQKLLKDALQSLAEDYAKQIAESAPNDPTDTPGYYVGGNGAHHAARGEGHFIELPHLNISVLPANMNSRNGYVRKKVVANYYARFLEDGTKFMEANPWIEEEVEGMGEEMLQEFCEELLGKILIMAGIAGGSSV